MTSSLAAIVLIATACAEPGNEPGGQGSDDMVPEAAAEFEQRAADVVSAWRDSEDASAWRTGLVLLEPSTVLPEDPGSDAAEGALRAGWLRTDVEFPDEEPDDGQVTFDGGDTLDLPLVAAAQAWQEVHTGEPECPEGTPAPPPSPSGEPDEPVSGAAECTVLTVTGAELETVTLATSRGPAEVPAWQFELAELDGALARVAVSPEQVSGVPVLDGIEFSYFQGLATAMGLVAVDGTEVSYQLGVGACDIDITPLVHETDDAVVLGGTARLDPEVDACTDQLLMEKLSVTLTEPLDQRPVLATTGEVLTFGRW